MERASAPAFDTQEPFDSQMLSGDLQWREMAGAVGHEPEAFARRPIDGRIRKSAIGRPGGKRELARRNGRRLVEISGLFDLARRRLAAR